MTILVTGATGTVGRQVIQQLVSRGADIRALVRDPMAANLPDEVALAKGEMLDIDSMRAALDGVNTLFLLNAVVPDELTQALITLNLAREAGIDRVVYLSVIHSDRYVDVPHFAAKFAVERMIERTGLAATILRPAYYMNNDVSLKDTILSQGIYPMPIGDKGLQMVDVRDIGEIAAIELLRRAQSSQLLPLERLNLVGPDPLTDADVARIWSETLSRPVTHIGTPQAFEQTLREFSPPWNGYDMRKMAERFQSDGMSADRGDIERLENILGRPLRSYHDLARDVAAEA
nr:NmrA/HSCARG family protein [Halomonas socia]